MQDHTRHIFITGTDTDAGKTYVSALLLDALNKAGKRTLGHKPIAAGCEQTEEGLRNDDALILQAAASIKLAYELVNPISFADPVAPHLAAQKLGKGITMQALQEGLDALMMQQADIILTEGAGGWRLPLGAISPPEDSSSVGKQAYLSDFVIANNMPVILVVGMKLGCLNHAALTLEAIQRDGLNCIGWVANQVAPDMPYYQENLASLQAMLNCPYIGEVKYGAKEISGLKLNF